MIMTQPPPIWKLLSDYRANGGLSSARLGQYFMREYLPKLVCPELFYADNAGAIKIINDLYDSYQWAKV